MLSADEIKANILASLPAHVGFAGLLSQLNMDQGDTLQRTGELAVLTSVCDDANLSNEIYATVKAPDVAFETLKTHPGWYRRSPSPVMPSFETDDRQTSRDQLAIAKAGMVAQRLTRRLWGIAVAQLLRLTFHQNYWSGTGYQIPDVLTPDEAAVSLRGLLGPLSWPINCVLDLCFIVGLILRWISKETQSNMWGLDNMLATNLLVANKRYSTLWSMLAMHLYLQTDFMAQLWTYHKDSDGNNGCSPLYWLFRLAFLTRYNYDPGSTAP